MHQNISLDLMIDEVIKFKDPIVLEKRLKVCFMFFMILFGFFMFFSFFKTTSFRLINHFFFHPIFFVYFLHPICYVFANHLNHLLVSLHVSSNHLALEDSYFNRKFRSERRSKLKTMSKFNDTIF